MSNADGTAHSPLWDELGAELASVIERHYEDLDEDVAQMRSVLQTAIHKLVGAYHALRATTDSAADGTAGGNGREDAAAAALVALQFEDVLTQLLQRLGDRCHRFRRLPALMLEGLVDAGSSSCDPGPQSMRRELAALLAQLEDVPRRDITPHAMDPGAVELFE